MEAAPISFWDLVARENESEREILRGRETVCVRERESEKERECEN